MTFLAPAAAWIAALLVPLILLHMLRLRRAPRRVPSLLLWQQTLQDERVNSPLRRLRRDPLLLLQILLLAALALAAMQPLFGTRTPGQAVVLVLDRSASMAARGSVAGGGAGGSTRFEAAKLRAAALFEEHAGSDVALVTFADGAELAVPFTRDGRAFAQALAALEVDEVGDDLAGALRLVAALGTQRELQRVVLISDGNLADAGDFALPFPLVFETMPPAGPNLGIVKLAARRDGPTAWRVFAAVAASGAREAGPRPARLLVEVDGEPSGEVVVAPAPDAPERVELPVQLTGAAIERGALLTLRLQPDGEDSLTCDDTAHLALLPGRLLRVRLDAELTTFARALAIFEDLELVGDASADLVITRAAPADDLLAPLTLSVGVVPAALQQVVAAVEGEARVIDHDRLDPLLTHVEFDDLLLLDDVRWQDGMTEADLERAGFTALVHGARGPLLVRQRTPRGDRTAYALLFDPERSTLPYRVAFPVLLSNLLTMARDMVGLRDLVAPRTGNLPAFVAPAGAEVFVTGPRGAAARLRADADGTVRGARAARVGAYEIVGAGPEWRVLGVSLLDADESRLAPRAALRVGELSVTARAPAAAVAASFWSTLVAVALVLACLEWWLYRRARRAHLPAGARA